MIQDILNDDDIFKRLLILELTENYTVQYTYIKSEASYRLFVLSSYNAFSPCSDMDKLQNNIDYIKKTEFKNIFHMEKTE